MSRIPLPFATSDVSALARSLSRELQAAADKPGHVQMLNMLSRAIGYKNFQHFKAQSEAGGRLAAPALSEPVDHLLVERVAGHFDENGLLLRWPGKLSHQVLALWCLWARFPAGKVLTEVEVNALIRAGHHFGDHVLIRRELCDHRLLSRTPDCREYRRIGRRPPADAAALIRHVEMRHATSASTRG